MDKRDYKIMVVDDEPEVADTMATILQEITGYSVQSFTDPFLALQALLKESYNLVITDVSMPKLDGFELIRRMRQETFAFDFIVVSAHKTFDNLLKARRAGANFIFFKPIDFAELGEAISHLFVQQQHWRKHLNELGATLR